jgi:uncharacterized membrane protein (UPF0127 family)
MSVPARGYAFNQTRQTYLATELRVADTHRTRLVGLLATSARDFVSGKGLWIVPCRGVHTLGMRFPIDVVYLNSAKAVVHVEENLAPWRLAPVRLQAASVVELPANTISESKTRIGDSIEIQVGTKGAS